MNKENCFSNPFPFRAHLPNGILPYSSSYFLFPSPPVARAAATATQRNGRLLFWVEWWQRGGKRREEERIKVYFCFGGRDAFTSKGGNRQLFMVWKILQLFLFLFWFGEFLPKTESVFGVTFGVKIRQHCWLPKVGLGGKGALTWPLFPPFFVMSRIHLLFLRHEKRSRNKGIDSSSFGFSISPFLQTPKKHIWERRSCDDGSEEKPFFTYLHTFFQAPLFSSVLPLRPKAVVFCRCCDPREKGEKKMDLCMCGKWKELKIGWH